MQSDNAVQALVRAMALLMTICLASSPVLHAAEPKTRSVACRTELVVLDKSAQQLKVRLRASCPLGREQLVTALSELDTRAFTDGATPRELVVDLGRVAEHPWLSTALAQAALNSKEWDKVHGKPRQRNINQYAGAVLRVNGALEGLVTGWTLQSVTTDKVQVNTIGKIPGLNASSGDKSLLPYDAALWLHYIPRPTRAEAAQAAVPAVIPPARLDE